MLALALMPAMIGRAIDRGLLQRSTSGLVTWAGVVLGLALFTAFAGGMRHRSALTNWLAAAYITIQATSRHAVRVGADLPRLIASGDVLAIGTTDVESLGNSFDIWARLSGGIVSTIVVAIIMLTTSLPLGLVVLIGVPVMMASTVLLLRPLRHRQDSYRELQGELSDQTVDIAQGIRILRGIGGEDSFSARYAAGSQRLRGIGIGVGRIESLLAAQEVLLPGLLTALVTWLAAHFALHGDITLGQLVAFYGYASFLVLPLSFFGEAADEITRGHVAAERVVKLLRLTSPIKEPTSPATPPPPGAELEDAASGLTIPPGVFLAVTCNEPDDAETLANRLARYVDDGEPTLGGVPLDAMSVAVVRDRILLAGNGDRIFAGTLRTSLCGTTNAPDGVGAEPTDHADDTDDTDDEADEVVLAALHAASAEDIVAALDAGLDTEVEEKGRNFSGGQLQRLRLARALIADPEILIAVEATSAVDAHTEARIAERIGAYRVERGRQSGEGSGADKRTTVLFTTSPLVLDHADVVAYVEDGRVVATGKHGDLLAKQRGYGALVTRDEDDAAANTADPANPADAADAVEIGDGVDRAMEAGNSADGADGVAEPGRGVDGADGVAEPGRGVDGAADAGDNADGAGEPGRCVGGAAGAGESVDGVVEPGRGVVDAVDAGDGVDGLAGVVDAGGGAGDVEDAPAGDAREGALRA